MFADFRPNHALHDGSARKGRFTHSSKSFFRLATPWLEGGPPPPPPYGLPPASSSLPSGCGAELQTPNGAESWPCAHPPLVLTLSERSPLGGGFSVCLLLPPSPTPWH